MRQINQNEGLSIIKTGKPVGSFYLRVNGIWIALDNSTGKAWTAEFKSKEECLRWLRSGCVSKVFNKLNKRGLLV